MYIDAAASIMFSFTEIFFKYFSDRQNVQPDPRNVRIMQALDMIFRRVS